MAQVSEIGASDLTAADLVRRFGAIPLRRIRLHPAPGTAVEQDVIDLDDHEDRLCELVDGILVEKVMGAYESYLAMSLGYLLTSYLREHDLGIVLGEAGMFRLAPGLVRIPDVSVILWDRLPGRHVSREPIWGLAPDLAVEVISKGNTPQEMDQKLREYFAAGIRQVWHVYPTTREVHVFSTPQQPTVCTEQQTLDGHDLLPGFSLNLQTFFAEPGQKA